MQTLIKRFTQETSDLNLVLLSMFAGLLSTKLLMLGPAAQFTLTSILVVALIAPVTCLCFCRNLPGRTLTLYQTSLILALSMGMFYDVFAVFMLLSMLFMPFGLNKQESLLLRSFLSHLADATSTMLALGNMKEANPLLRGLMRDIGELPALLISKALLVGLPLIYGYFALDEEEFRLLSVLVLVVGLSLTARNLILFF